MSSQNNDTSSNTRPYRSKRLRPCDICRRRKHACRIDGQPPCSVCQNLRVECTFDDPPVKRHRSDAPPQENVAPYLNFDFTEADWQFNDRPWHLSQTPLTRLDNLDSENPPFIDESGESPDRGTRAITYPSHNRQSPTNDSEVVSDTALLVQDATLGVSATSFQDHGTSDFALLLDSWDKAIGTSPSSARNVEQPHMTPWNNQNSGQPQLASISQSTRSLDELEGFSAQYFGLSGETDPYMLRHFRFADDGDCLFFKVHFRRQASDLRTADPVASQAVPVHFMISSDELGNAIKPETAVRKGSTPTIVQEELAQLVPPEVGQRLIGLFLQYVFPSLPVLSRSRFGINAQSSIPSVSSLAKTPPYLLAAIYAVSIQFCQWDPKLCVSNVYTRPPTDRLWRIAFEEILREIHTPHLAVLQAALLYLQKPQVGGSSAAADTPFRWSFMGLTTSLATTLALHLDCRHWPIPSWEKRLRRRLWWIVYSETTWRSLLLGFPNPINDDFWDVDELDDEDFILDEPSSPASGPFPESSKSSSLHLHGDIASDFVHLSRLSRIAWEVYHEFYTLKATRRTAKSFVSSLKIARPLRARLQEWYNSVPSHLQVQLDSERGLAQRLYSNSTSHIKLAYLTLELFIYRALLRPLGDHVPNDPVPPEEGTSPASAHGSPQKIRDLDSGAVEATVSAAESCAKLILSFTASLDSKDFGGFWYSWSRVCFSTTSNFIMLLLIQAPDVTHAREAKNLLDNWRQTLRIQSGAFEQMKLGLLRLDAIHWSGLQKLFRCPPYVEDLLREQQASESNAEP